MKFFGPRDPVLRMAGGPPDCSTAPRRYRPALAATGARLHAVVQGAAAQGLPIAQRRLFDRARSLESFWRFLESEFASRRLGSLASPQADPRLSFAVQELYGWFAQCCDILPAVAECVAQAKSLNQDSQWRYTSSHPSEYEWKWRRHEPLHFGGIATVIKGSQTGVEGVITAQDKTFQLHTWDDSRTVTFTADDVCTVQDDPNGLRLDLEPGLPYVSLLLLTDHGDLLVDPVLRRAGFKRP
ncbi:hypothetical protein ABZZ36_28810 [Actinacidiphila glaucinigra]|uniref:hypothetical protein n=1 Tax=Actinacidiphila glaucinigra TaxID=235986 RepID=UPI0033B44F88